MLSTCQSGEEKGTKFKGQKELHKQERVRRDTSVGIATRNGLDGPGIESRWGARFSAPVQTGPGAHPASYTMGTGHSMA